MAGLALLLGFRFLSYKEWQVESFGHIHSFHGCATPLWGNDHTSHLILPRVRILWLPRTILENGVLMSPVEVNDILNEGRVMDHGRGSKGETVSPVSILSGSIYGSYSLFLITLNQFRFQHYTCDSFINNTKSEVIFAKTRPNLEALWYLVFHMLLYSPFPFLTHHLSILSSTRSYWKNDGTSGRGKRREIKKKKT